MGIRFGRKKEAPASVAKPPEEKPDLLKQLCDKYNAALYEDLNNSLLLKPEGRGTYEEAMEKARKYEEKNDPLNARASYLFAGALALYEKEKDVADVTDVITAFEKVAELSDKVPELSFRTFEEIRKDPGRAKKIAREFYEKQLQPIEKNEHTLSKIYSKSS